jgi:hypothetical protein
MNHFTSFFTDNRWVPFNATTTAEQSASALQTARILDGQRQNGLVPIAIPEDPNAFFRLRERVAHHNKSTSYYDALNGTLEWNAVAEAYFSADNQTAVQDAIRRAVSEQSAGSIDVPPRDIDQLRSTMREVFLRHAEHAVTDVPGQVARLNKRVVDDMAPRAHNEALGYLKYLQDQSMLTVPMARGGVSDRVYKQLEPRPFVDVRPMKPYM